MKPNGVLLVAGSHRCRKTTTNSILNYLENKLSISGITIFREQISSAVPDIKFVSRIDKILQKCETVVLCFPLYFDTLPYPLLAALELLSNLSKKYNNIKAFSIVHCGLPESAHCENALLVSKNFYEIMGFNHSGSVIIPDTGGVDGSLIEKNKRIVSLLNTLIDSINVSTNGNDEIKLVGKPSMHPLFFRVFGNIIMKHFAKKNKVSVFQKEYDN